MIPKEVLKRLRRIEIHTARLANDQLAGSYHSVFKGRGIAFRRGAPCTNPATTSASSTGTSPPARATPHVKVFREEREMTVMLLVDMSGSQAFGTQGMLKRELVAGGERRARLQRHEEQRPRRAPALHRRRRADYRRLALPLANRRHDVIAVDLHDRLESGHRRRGAAGAGRRRDRRAAVGGHRATAAGAPPSAANVAAITKRAKLAGAAQEWAWTGSRWTPSTTTWTR
jgi:hypothetical protein